MTVDVGQTGLSPVQFTGKRGGLFGLLLRGYILMLPTIGVYRFWVTTAKRQYYWQNTIIDGEPLEYTGSAIQLLMGFLFALAFFLPIYVAFFYLSTQSQDIALIGYGAVIVVVWFLSGYAIYRARDFRLSRTLWRGIRFDQKGSAMGYAVRRFAWSLLMILTLGLAYPFMAASLWRYRYAHSWYGDRKFSWTGSWKTIAGPFYRVYFLVAAFAVAAIIALGAGDYTTVDGVMIPGAMVWGLGVPAFLCLWFGVIYFRSREATRMFSEVRIGDAAVTVRVKARTLFAQFLIYGFLVAVLVVLAFVVLGLLVASISDGGAPAPTDLARIAQSSITSIVVVLVCYLAFLGGLGLFSEVFLGLGFWSAVASGAVVTNAASLHTTQATAEDLALVGEGLADALNVGAY